MDEKSKNTITSSCKSKTAKPWNFLKNNVDGAFDPMTNKRRGTWNVIHDEDEDVIVRVGAGRIEHVYKWYACCMACIQGTKGAYDQGRGGKIQRTMPYRWS
jgi:hypothetical protein